MLNKRFISGTVILSVLLMLFTACNNNGFLMTVEGVGSEVAVNITSNYSKSTPGARAIAPNTWTSEEINGMTFKLSGVSRNGMIVSERVLELDTDNNSETTLTYDVWDLTLCAYNGTGDLLLQGFTTVDLTAGGETIHFYLETTGVTTKGSVKLAGTYIDEDKAAKTYQAYILDYYTGEVIRQTEVTNTTASLNFKMEATGLDPKDYIFAVKFFSTKNEPIGYWSDMLTVKPGKQTLKEDIECGDIIQKIPAAPENLKVTDVADTESAYGTYDVRLDWEDKSNNEENFVIYVYKYDTWKTAASRKLERRLGMTEDLENNKYLFMKNTNDYKNMRVEGSILAGNTTCVLRLETGYIYDFEIAAENCVGESTKCTRVASDGDAGYPATADSNVAKMMITYNLNGGVLTEDGAVYTGYSKIKFYKYAGSPITLWDVGAENLKKAGHNFTCWSQDIYSIESPVAVTELDIYNPTVAGAIKDPTVWAMYLTDNAIEFEVEDFANDLGIANVSAEDKDGNDVKNGDVVITLGETQSIKFTVTDAESVYNEYEFRIDGPEGSLFLYKGSYNTYTIPNLTSFKNGTYSVIITAKNKSNGKLYGTRFNVKITR